MIAQAGQRLLGYGFDRLYVAGRRYAVYDQTPYLERHTTPDQRATGFDWALYQVMVERPRPGGGVPAGHRQPGDREDRAGDRARSARRADRAGRRGRRDIGRVDRGQRLGRNGSAPAGTALRGPGTHRHRPYGRAGPRRRRRAAARRRAAHRVLPLHRQSGAGGRDGRRVAPARSVLRRGDLQGVHDLRRAGGRTDQRTDVRTRAARAGLARPPPRRRRRDDRADEQSARRHGRHRLPAAGPGGAVAVVRLRGRRCARLRRDAAVSGRPGRAGRRSAVLQPLPLPPRHPRHRCFGDPLGGVLRAVSLRAALAGTTGPGELVLTTHRPVPDQPSITDLDGRSWPGSAAPPSGSERRLRPRPGRPDPNQSKTAS